MTRLKELLLAHKDCPVTAMQKKAYLGRSSSSYSYPANILSLFILNPLCVTLILLPFLIIAAGVDENAASALVMPMSVPAPVSVNGLSVRAAEAVAVLAGMGSGQWSNTAGDASSQSQPTSR